MTASLIEAAPQALQRLLDVAYGYTIENEPVAEFLLSLHDGNCYLFPLSSFDSLNIDTVQDCLTVLAYTRQSGIRLESQVHGGASRLQALAGLRLVVNRRTLRTAVEAAKFDAGRAGQAMKQIADAYINSGKI